MLTKPADAAFFNMGKDQRDVIVGMQKERTTN
jgi:hypothetical protein